MTWVVNQCRGNGSVLSLTMNIGKPVGVVYSML